MRYDDETTLRIIDVGPHRINRLNDRFAKYLLAGPKSKPVLIDFINGVLLLDGTDKIVDLGVISGELVQDAARMKLSLLDVSAKLMDGRTVDIEVQVVNYKDFKKRGPFYWAMRHAKKLEAGMFYTQIKPTITICLLAFDLFEEEEAYRNSYSIRNDKSGNRLCEDLGIIYLELPKFLRYLGEGHPRTGLERWLLYFSNEEGERMDKAVAENTALERAKEIEAIFWADAEEKEAYFQHQRLLMDEYSAAHTFEYLLAQAKEESAQVEGKLTQVEEKLTQAEGKVTQAEEKAAQAEEKVTQAEGKAAQAEEKVTQAEEKAAKAKEETAQAEEKVTQAARNLLEKGFDVETIIQILGLSREDIEKLR
jgi:predicted transposase/invertase (TIGR01784 family)